MGNPHGKGAINRFFRFQGRKRKTGGNWPTGFSKGNTMQTHRHFLRRIIVKITIKVKIHVVYR
jgi:hypothetical protein